MIVQRRILSSLGDKLYAATRDPPHTLRPAVNLIIGCSAFNTLPVPTNRNSRYHTCITRPMIRGIDKGGPACLTCFQIHAYLCSLTNFWDFCPSEPSTSKRSWLEVGDTQGGLSGAIYSHPFVPRNLGSQLCSWRSERCCQPRQNRTRR